MSSFGFWPFNSSTSAILPVTGGSSGGGTQGPKGDKGDPGDSVTAGAGEPSTIIPGVSVYIDAVSGEVYVYEPD